MARSSSLAYKFSHGNMISHKKSSLKRKLTTSSNIIQHNEIQNEITLKFEIGQYALHELVMTLITFGGS